MEMMGRRVIIRGHKRKGKKVKKHKRRIKTRKHKKKDISKKYKIKIVGPHDLQDFGGMNYYAAKHLKFKPIPEKNEIFIEKDKKNYMDSTILHEITEAELMKKGMKYKQAHRKSVEAEIDAGLVPEHVLLEVNEDLFKL